MDYGTRLHDWELDEVELMEALCLSVYMNQPIVADQQVPSRHAAVILKGIVIGLSSCSNLSDF